MAIRRCPYCKAIIDEQDKYCNNCGTQLLFPEDEFVEEEIPGEKIIDEDESEEMEEKDTTEEQELEAELEEEEELIGDEEDEAEEEGEEEDEDEAEKDESEKLAEEKEAEEEEGGPQEDRLEAEAEEGKDTDELEELALGGEKDAGAEPAEKEPGPEVEEGQAGTDDKERYEEEVEEEEDELRGPDVSGTGGPAESDKVYEVSIEEDELIVKTKDVPRRSESIAETIKEKVRPPDTGSLPPWASRIRETPAIVESEEEAQAPKALSREWTTDSGIGIPERITQAALPYTDTGGPAAGREKDHVDEETEAVTAEEEEAAPAGTLSLKLRAKLVDWVFVTALWVISLWFTAQVVGVSFFRLLFGSPLPVLAFYVILLGLYFFLFLYFLGETLGDHYFSE
ncbi:MAG: hypothetical protein A2W03_06910 [Candidatus Aminicenantes bacterium RBG_16_63_16]|nr:MAG: hypothetical protein A2W03_06910 [Candidatus Aminicenantes bacterium RBG_16_63_16]